MDPESNPNVADKCLAALAAESPLCATARELLATHSLDRNVVGLVCEYTLECEAVGRRYEQRDDWASALRYYEAASQFQFDAWADYRAGFCYLVGMNAARIDTDRAHRLLYRSAAAGCFDALALIAPGAASTVSRFLLPAIAESGRTDHLGPQTTSFDIQRAADADPCCWLGSQNKNRRDQSAGSSPLQNSAIWPVTFAPMPGTYADARYVEVVGRAEGGCAHAQFCLGDYLVRYRPRESMRWYLRAAQRGHAWAQRCIEQHDTSPAVAGMDAVGPREWMRRSAEQGDVVAMNHLGNMYDAGDLGIERDVAAAVRWLERAAAAGCKLSAAELARRRKRGHYLFA